MSYFLWGCRGILTLITLRSERVKSTSRESVFYHYRYPLHHRCKGGTSTSGIHTVYHDHQATLCGQAPGWKMIRWTKSGFNQRSRKFDCLGLTDIVTGWADFSGNLWTFSLCTYIWLSFGPVQNTFRHVKLYCSSGCKFNLLIFVEFCGIDER